MFQMFPSSSGYICSEVGDSVSLSTAGDLDSNMRCPPAEYNKKSTLMFRKHVWSHIHNYYNLGTARLYITA